MDVAKFLTQSTRNPKTILQIVISISIGLLVLWVFLVSKMDLPSSTDTSRITFDTASTSMENSGSTTPVETAKKTELQFQNALTTFFFMIVVLGGIWIWTKGRKHKSHHAHQHIKELTKYVIAQGAQIHILEINNEIWVIGTTTSNINVLHRYPKSEWHPSTVPSKDHEMISKNNFDSIFKLQGN